MTIHTTLHDPATVYGDAMPMDHDPQLGRLSLEDGRGNRVVVFMPAVVAVAMAEAYRLAMCANATPADEVAL